MYLKEKLSARKKNFGGQQGVGMLLIIGIISIVILGIIAATTPQIRNLVLPQKTLPIPLPSTPKYSEKQQLYLRNKETIQKSLNLNEEQFKLLVEGAGKN